MAGGGQRMAGRADDQAAHQARIAEAHLGLGGMDVHIHLLRRHLEEQRHQRMAVAGKEILIGPAHGALQQPVAHGPIVDEQELLGRRCLVQGRQADESRQAMALAFGIDGQRILGEFAAHDGGEPREARGRRIVQQRGCGGIAQHHALAVAEAEGDLGMRHGQALDHILGMAEFAAAWI